MFKWLKRFFNAEAFDAYYRNPPEQNKNDALMLIRQELEVISKTLISIHADKVEEVVNNFAIKRLSKRIELLENRLNGMNSQK